VPARSETARSRPWRSRRAGVTSRSAISSSLSCFAVAQVRAISSGAASSFWTWSSTASSTSTAGTLVTAQLSYP